MATTIKGLKTTFKKTNRRVDKAFARYEKALLPLYMPLGHDSDNRRGRDSKFYEKERYAGREWDAYKRAYQPVGQDYLDLCKLEAAIDAAVDEREKILSELEKAGVNPYVEQELWQ